MCRKNLIFKKFVSYNHDISVILDNKYRHVCHGDKMKKKIAIVLSGFMGVYIDYLINLCKRNNIEFDLFTIKSTHFSQNYHKEIIEIDASYNLKNIKSIKKINKVLLNTIKTNNYDYVLSDCLPLSFGCNVFHGVTTACKIKQASFILYRIILYLGHLNKILHEKNFFTNCPKIITVSTPLKQDYVKHCHIKPEKINVAFPGMSFVKDTSDYKIPKLDTQRGFVVGMSANGFVTKGGYLFLEAIRHIKQNRPDVKIKAKIIHSKFEKNYILKLYLKLFKLENIVEICPFQENMEDFYRSLNCFVCPSKYEAFGRVVAESMNYKIPTITSNKVGASDLIKDGINGFIYNADKSANQNLAQKIVYVYDHYKELEELTNTGRNTVQNITWENFAYSIFYALYPKEKSNQV